MILSCQVLTDVADVNSFSTAKNVEFSAGDTVTVYLQLVDASKAGRRFMPASGALLTAIVGNIDDARKVTRSCTQPFPTSDPSIWTLSLLAADGIKGTQNLTLTLNEAGKITHGLVKNLFRVSPSDCL